MAMDYAKYVRDNPDLAAAATAAGMSASDFGEQHWEGGGKNEGRASTPEMSAEEKKDNVEYVRNNPDLRENAEAHGFTADETAQFATWHYDTYGKNEGRLNTPGVVNLPSAADQVLGPEHFQGRPVRSVLEASVRAGDPSEMWEAREDIGEAAGTPWGLDQFTAEGWNLAADRPYGRGLLGDTIGVETEIGQLTDTANKRFLQDRYEDAALANDFPVGWVGEEGEWKGPSDLAGYWSQVTNAVRNEAGEISSITDRPDTGWAGTDVLPVGDRWSGAVRPDGAVRATGGGLLNPTVPTFRGPGYQDWTRFMPTDFQLAEGGGRHYQTGVMPGLLGGGGPTQWAGPNASYPNWNDAAGGYANDVAILSGGGTRGVPPVTYIPPGMETGATTTGGDATTWPWGAGPEGAEGVEQYDEFGVMRNRLTGERVARPQWGIQFPSKDTGGFKIVPSYELKTGADAWAYQQPLAEFGGMGDDIDYGGGYTDEQGGDYGLGGWL